MPENLPFGDSGLTVSAVSTQLGVSPSTLRSWDRRYGVGPTGRQAGSRRMYSAGDVERIRRMIRLIEEGLPAKQAAVESNEFPAHDDARPVDVADLLMLARRSPESLDALLWRETMRDGLVSVWSRLIEPALAELSENTQGARPGHLVETVIYGALMQLQKKLAVIAGPTTGIRVSVASWHDRFPLATVVGGALQWEGMDVRIQIISRLKEEEAVTILRKHMDSFGPHIVVAIGRLPLAKEQFSELISGTQASFFLMCDDLPDFAHPKLQRVRTALACVEEVRALVQSVGFKTWD